MAINTINATIQMRYGKEADFDPDKMTTGEWAVSTDLKYVRMCFAPGVVARMATYEAFEEDMKQIQIILATCQDIQVAVEEFNRLAAQHESNAKTYANQANNSKTAAANSASAAKTSETNAKASETNAKSSEEAAAASESTASTKATAASNSAKAAKTSETNAKASETNAANSKKAAATSATNAADSAATAENKANAASQFAEDASDSALLSESWAVGNTGIREGEDINNSKYWAEMAQRVVEAASEGGIIPIGTITFANLPTSGMKTGYMYNISNAFTSDTRFEDGGNIYYAPGANVYYTAGGKWDVLTGAQVTGVKGNAESSYRKGNVNLTPANIGAVPVTRKINNKALSTDITLTATDVGAVSEEDKVNIGYGTCTTAADVAAKEVTLEDNPNWELKPGSIVFVKFSNTNTASRPTLNVNSTGAKPIYYRGAAINAGYLAAKRTYIFRYNGTQYELVGDVNTNTTYSVMTGATADAAGKSGLVPTPAAGANAKFLRGDGTWQTPTNTTYGVATTSANGLMSSADKTKLDGIASGANKTTIVNNLLATATGSALDATQGKALDAKISSLNSSFAQSLTWKQICNAVAPSNVPNLNNYDAKEFLIIINDGFYNYVRIKPSIKVTNHERIYANGTDTYMQFTFNLWAGTGPTQINITAMVKDGVTLDPGTNAKVTVYYR